MRDLTTPKTITTDTKQYVNSGTYRIELDNAGGIDLTRSFYKYTVMSIPSRQLETFTIPADQLPAAFRSKLKELHAMVIAHAENNGLLDPGTDTDDL